MYMLILRELYWFWLYFFVFNAEIKLTNVILVLKKGKCYANLFISPSMYIHKQILEKNYGPIDADKQQAKITNETADQIFGSSVRLYARFWNYTIKIRERNYTMNAKNILKRKRQQ